MFSPAGKGIIMLRKLAGKKKSKLDFIAGQKNYVCFLAYSVTLDIFTWVLIHEGMLKIYDEIRVNVHKRLYQFSSQVSDDFLPLIWKQELRYLLNQR